MRPTVLFFAVLTVVRGIGQILALHVPFFAVSADETVRAMLSVSWSAHPSWVPLGSGIWMPLERYIDGSLFRFLIHDPLWAPAITAFVASTVLLVALFQLVETASKSWGTAAIAVLLLSCHPWFVWLSGAPMLDIYYLACLLVALCGLQAWLATGAPWAWTTACLFTNLAAAFHVQSWLIIGCLDALLVAELCLGRIPRPRVGELWAFIGLSNLYILATAISQYGLHGDPFYFFGEHVRYARQLDWVAKASLGDRLMYYPKLGWRFIGWLPFSLGLLGLRAGKVPARLVALSALSLVLFSAVNLIVPPAAAAPDRYCLLFVLGILPAAAQGLARAWAFNRGLAAGIFIFVAAHWVFEAAHPVNVFDSEGYRAGRQLSPLLDLDPSSRFLVEVDRGRFWKSFSAIQLGSMHFDRMVLDVSGGEFSPEPSLLLDPPPQLMKGLREKKIRWLVLRRQESPSPGFKWVSSVGSKLGEFGDRVIFELPAPTDPLRAEPGS